MDIVRECLILVQSNTQWFRAKAREGVEREVDLMSEVTRDSLYTACIKLNPLE